MKFRQITKMKTNKIPFHFSKRLLSSQCQISNVKGLYLIQIRKHDWHLFFCLSFQSDYVKSSAF